MNGEATDEAVASRHLGIALERGQVAEVDIDGLDRRNAGRGRREQADGAGEPIGLGEQAVAVTV